jgi:O-antigen/teichoic acid export membrane protein
MSPRQLVRDSLGFALSQYVARIALMARGVVAAAWVGPTAYGAWNALMLVLEYTALSQLGTQQGLDQVVPQRMVEGDPARLERTKRAGLFNIMVLGLLAFPLVGLAFRFTGGQILAFWGAAGIGVVLVCMVLGNVLNYHTTLLRSHGDITAVAWSLGLQSLAGALLGLALIPWLGVWGLLWGWLAGTLSALVFARTRSRHRVPLTPGASVESRALLAVGLPIFLFSGTSFIMRSLDRAIVLRFLGTTDLGYYTLAIMALTSMLYASDSISYVLYPRLVTRYRESGQDPTTLRDLVLGPLQALSLFMPWLTGLAYLAADEIVAFLLPRFGPGISSLRILGYGAAGLALASIPSFTLITMGGIRYLVGAAVGAALLAGGLDLLALRAGRGIEGVAAATLVAYLAYGALLLWLVFGRILGPRGPRLRLVVRLLVPLGLAVGLAWGVEHATPGLGRLGWVGLARLAATAATFSLLYALAVTPLARGLGVRGIVQAIRSGAGRDASGRGGGS